MSEFARFYRESLYPFQDGILHIVKSIDAPFYLTGGTALSRYYSSPRYSDDLDLFVNDHPEFDSWVEEVFRGLEGAAKEGWCRILRDRTQRFASAVQVFVESNGGDADNKPMVLYQGERNWSAPLDLHDLLKVPGYLKPYLPGFSYLLMDLSSYSDEQIKGELFVQLALQVMKHVDSPDLMFKLEQKLFPLVVELFGTKTGLEAIKTMLYYLSNSSDHLDKDRVIRLFTEAPLDKMGAEVIMTLAEQWRQEGEEKGIEKGKIGIVSRQLTIRFRDDAEQWLERLKELSADELDIVSERLLTAGSIADVFSGLGN